LKRPPSWKGCGKRSERFIGGFARIKESAGELVALRKVVVQIDAELVLTIVSREGIGGLSDSRGKYGLWIGNRKRAVWQLEIEKRQCHRIYIGTVGSNGYPAKGSGLPREKFSECILALFRDNERYLKMRASARAHALSHFTWDGVAREMVREITRRLALADLD